MKIDERSNALDRVKDVAARVVHRSGESEVAAPVICEHLMEIYINETLTMKVVCTPEHLAYLALGRLLTEGIIKSANEVESVYVCEHGNRAKVLLADASYHDSENFVETTQTCCTGNHVLNDMFVKYPETKPVAPIEWKTEHIFAIAEHFANGTEMHKATKGAHSCFLTQGSQVLFSCEDIGRHNALDKAIGYALANGIDLRKCTLFSSGRLASDMVIKAVRARVPILASKAVATAEAIELAQHYHLTLIASAREDSMKVY